MSRAAASSAIARLCCNLIWSSNSFKPASQGLLATRHSLFIFQEEGIASTPQEQWRAPPLSSDYLTFYIHLNKSSKECLLLFVFFSIILEGEAGVLEMTPAFFFPTDIIHRAIPGIPWISLHFTNDLCCPLMGEGRTCSLQKVKSFSLAA